MSKCPFSNAEIPDVFEQARIEVGLGFMEDQSDPVTMVLRHKDLRKCAHDWKTFSSESVPGRIVVPSEVSIRDIREVPFEVDPPMHTDYRAILEPWFKRPLGDDYKKSLRRQIAELLTEAIAKESIEAIYDFALPLQSRALTLLFNTDYSEAETFIGWGTHVFRSENDPLDANKAQMLYEYIDAKIAAAEEKSSEDLFSVLLQADFQGRKLTHTEIKGVVVLTFSGGRDTVINMVTNTLAYLAYHPEAIARLRDEPEIRTRATEELIRYFSPLTHMGRVASADTEICDQGIKSDSRISLCWASANRDANVFENPNDVMLDRKLNPHVAFGFGVHNCLGATHARTVLQILIDEICQKLSSLEVLNFQENVETLGSFSRKVGYHKLHIKFNGC